MLTKKDLQEIESLVKLRLKESNKVLKEKIKEKLVEELVGKMTEFKSDILERSWASLKP